jgi:rhodanese-related sulfurtransferase
MDLKGSSTIGFERHHNAMLEIDDEETFVDAAIAKLGVQPPNFKAIVELNHGPLLTGSVELQHLFPAEVERRLADGALVIDTRDDIAFAEGHISGALWIPLRKSGFGTKLAWLAADAPQLVFVTERDLDAVRAAGLAAAVGLGPAVRAGGLLAGGVPAWTADGQPLTGLERLPVDALDVRMQADDRLQVLDVREAAEFAAGHIPGSVCVTWHDITGIPDGIDASRPIAVICASSLRAGVAAAVLQHHGAADVIHVVDGGVPKWGAIGGSLSTALDAPTRALA